MLGIDDPRLEVVHESPKGSKFKILNDGRLYFIHMLSGGVRPDICGPKFTSFMKAKNSLDKYFRNNPKPTPRPKAKVEDKEE